MLEQQILEHTNINKWSPIPPFVKERIGDRFYWWIQQTKIAIFF
jgi:hypothetical protein